MILRKYGLIVIACSCSMMLLAGLWHKVIMLQFYVEETGASHEGTGVIFIAYMILAMLMLYLYSRMNTGAKPIVEGIRFGAVIGLLWVFPHELAMAGAHGESMTYVFINATWHLIEQGTGGLVIGFLYRN